MDIGQLADAAGLTRRAVRFYVQRGLLPPPLGLGRGRHYDATHLARLRQLQELQAAGHSLDAIGRILSGEDADAVAPPVPRTESPPPRRAKPTLSAELWTRLRVVEGVELHFDATRHRPDVERLRALRDAIRDVFRATTNQDEDDDNEPPVPSPGTSGEG